MLIERKPAMLSFCFEGIIAGFYSILLSAG